MINVAVLDAVRRQFAAAGSALVAEMSAFLPSIWPPHRYDPDTAPTGAFEEGIATPSAPHHPGYSVQLPDWTDHGTGYSFGASEAVKVGLFQNWLFTRSNPEWLAGYFAPPPAAIEVFSRFGTRGDRSFEAGKFPRDQWKAGSFDVDAWEAARLAIGSAAAVILSEIDTINSENVVLTERDWIITKIVQGPVVGQPGETDSTFANVPELLEDVNPDWHDFPAYIRVSEHVQDGDPTWTAAQFAFAFSAARYDQLFARLTSFASDFIDSCVTVWRTGSQTHRRDQYE